MEKNYVKLIQANISFQTSGNHEINYDFKASEYAELIRKYDFEKLLAMSDAEKVRILLAWVNKYVRHRGNYDNSDVQDALTLLEICYGKLNFGVNCLAMSTILCECLLAVGVKARVVYMMPRAVEDDDNHVVVEAFVTEWNKWVMLDATYGSYCVNAQGVALHLGEIRTCICNEEEYFFSDGMNYNGDTNLDLEDVRQYYAKNLFFLRCKRGQGYGAHRDYGNMLEIAPVEFDVRERMVQNINYRIRKYGEYEIFTRWLQYEISDEHGYMNMEQFYR